MRAANTGARDESPVREPDAPAAHDEAASAATDAPAAQEETASAVANTPDDVAAALRPAFDPQSVPLPPIAKPVVHRSRDEICDTLAKSAQSNALPIAYFIRLLFQESGFDAGSVSSAGAQGIAQFMPETAATEGLKNPFDPLQAIPASARLLRKLFDQFGNLGLAAAAYNAGPKRVQDWLASKGKGRLPDETQGYVKIVTGKPADTWRVASASGTELTVPRRAPCQEVVPPPPPRVVVAAKTLAKKSAHRTQVAAAIPGKPAKTPAKTHKLPIQQLAARKHKTTHKNQTLAQR
jgi:transglycosylase-like protein with SLT domain